MGIYNINKESLFPGTNGLGNAGGIPLITDPNQLLNFDDALSRQSSSSAQIVDMRLEDSDLDPSTAKPFTNVFSENTTLDYIQA
jgi:hypothetical protein